MLRRRRESTAPQLQLWLCHRCMVPADVAFQCSFSTCDAPSAGDIIIASNDGAPSLCKILVHHLAPRTL